MTIPKDRAQLVALGILAAGAIFAAAISVALSLILQFMVLKQIGASGWMWALYWTYVPTILLATAVRSWIEKAVKALGEA